MQRFIIRAALCVAAVGILHDAATAGWRSRRPVAEGDYVVAVSRHGNGTVSGPVRAGRKGYEVRLPGGTWVGCRTSCAETLRVETVDIFENEGRMSGYGSMQNECGIFGCLEFGYRW
jgi:hypothetical protein